MATATPTINADASDIRVRNQRSWLQGVLRFAKKKPLGFACGVVVVFFLLIGDVVPETLNALLSLIGLGSPVPYLADLLEKHLSFVYPYSQQALRDRLQGSSAEHLLGTDANGRDVLSRLLYGARVSVMVSLGAVLISEFFGSSIGISSGYYGGKIDTFAFRVVDVFQALPGLVLLITILGIFGTGLWNMIIAIAVISIPNAARLIRAQTISIMSMPYIEAAKALGSSDIRLMTRHVLPNVFPLMVLSSTVRLGAIVLIEASISFLGYGLPPPFPSWGQMLSIEGRDSMRVAPGLAIYPGLAIALLVFSYNLFGDALRDVLDPRMRGT